MKWNNIYGKLNAISAKGVAKDNEQYLSENLGRVVVVDGIISTIIFKNGCYALSHKGRVMDLDGLTKSIRKVGLTNAVNDYLSFIGKTYRQIREIA